jgi:hypothetical protein
MSNGSGAPSWLVGLLAVFAIAAVISFVLMVARHAELQAVTAEHSQIKDFEIPRMRVLDQQLKDEIPKLEARIVARREEIASLGEVEKTALTDLDRLVQDNKTRLGETAEAQRTEVKTYAEALREAPERRTEVSQEEERAFVQDRDFDESRRKLRDEIEVASRELEKQRKDGRAKIVALDARIKELQDRERFLTSRLDAESKSMRPKGMIAAAQPASQGFVVIDRGRRHQLRRGTRFTVFNLRAGKPQVKGEIEVVSVDEAIATCRVITENDPNDPLIAGDLIHNPVWDPDKVKTFVVRGDFRRFGPDELNRLIEGAGGRTEHDLRSGVDYLVAGGNAEELTQLAVRLGVKILSEEQLLDLVKPGN